jgi:hypothetical protein
MPLQHLSSETLSDVLLSLVINTIALSIWSGILPEGSFLSNNFPHIECQKSHQWMGGLAPKQLL